MRRNQKLAAKYYGPYVVLKRIGEVTYQLNLPDGSKVHDVFHVSQLKKKIGHGKIVHTELPGVNEEGEIKLEPEAILQRRMIKKGNAADIMVLIKWKGRTDA